ncbi:tail protein X [Ascidiaceihabitans sp.]|uniref:tail protein X n=1 Tax=Ascidiaceihabitans sp. TaxID=1872644 RepID=UPI003299FFC7
MMAGSDQFYVSSDGDVVDQIVFNHYGNTAGGQVEAVLLANPGLPALGAVLDAGIRIRLPDLTDDAPVEALQLWD